MHSANSILSSVLVHLIILGEFTTPEKLVAILTPQSCVGITWVLWTAGAAAITASLGGGINCSYVTLYYVSRHAPANDVNVGVLRQMLFTATS